MILKNRRLDEIVLMCLFALEWRLCNAPSGALGSPTWTREVTQGNSEGTGFSDDPSTQDNGKGSEVKVEV